MSTIRDITIDLEVISDFSSIIKKLKNFDVNKNVILTETHFLKHLDGGGYNFILSYTNCPNVCFAINFIPQNNINTILKKKIGKKDYSVFVNLYKEEYKDFCLFGIFQNFILYVYLMLKIVKKNNVTPRDNQNLLTNLFNDYPLKLYEELVKLKKVEKTNHIMIKLFEDKMPILFNNFNFPSFYSLIKKYYKTIDIQRDFKAPIAEEITLYNKKRLNNRKDNKFKKQIESNYRNFMASISIQNLAVGDFTQVSVGEERLQDNEYYLFLLFTQVLIFLYCSYNDVKFLHNDLKINNVLVFESDDITVRVKDLEFNFDDPIVFKINDFDLSLVTGGKNDQITKTKFTHLNNSFSDIHYLFASVFQSNFFIKKYNVVYNEVYNKLIKGRCSQCDKIYKTFQKKKEVEADLHYVFEDNDFNQEEIYTFLKTSAITNKFRSIIED